MEPGLGLWCTGNHRGGCGIRRRAGCYVPQPCALVRRARQTIIQSPNWIFGPVWTTLYVLSAFSVWRILRLPKESKTRRLGLTLFYFQLVLNAAWPWMFFGAHSPLLGVINIIPQFLVILVTVGTFYRLDRLAAWCLVPLVAWVGYASILTIAIWQLN